MALSLPLGPRLGSEPLNHPPGAPRELDIVGCTVCPASREESTSPEQAQTLGQDSLSPPEHFQGGPRGNEPATHPPRRPTPSSCEDPAGGKRCEHPISGLEVLEAEQNSQHLCLLGLGRRLQDLEQGLGRWALAQSGMVQLQALQADLRGAAERVEALLAFGEGLAQRSEPRAWAALEQILQALGAYRDSIFRRLWQLQAQLVSYSLVFEKANTLDQDLEVEGDSDWPGPGGVWGPWAPSSLPTSAELEWDPAGDIGGLGPLGQKTARTLGVPCELCCHRGPQGRGQGLEDAHTSHSQQDMLESGLSHQKHLAGHQRHSLLRKPQDKKRQASPHLQDVRLEGNPGAPDPASRRPLTFLLILFLLLVGAMFLLPVSGGPCCSNARIPRTPYLVLSYVNGLPPV
ncbi:nesprin-4 isoform X3 [Nomascus leucogenys]|uniref:Spectrin repeat containing nuclear envelope family member 4 n=1 Tax=Nomascus leucogenys TaxID=61853 RepID=G1RLL8_NOMLE|nr:nesprin-4 isoform X3 [Nomascus leucogenys]